jgi:PBSX family phage terminase large subunit
MTSTAPEIVLSGPAGTGKSRACLEKLHDAALRYPRSRLLIVRKTRESLTESAMVTFERDVIGLSSPILEHGGQRSHRQSYPYSNGSVIVIGGMDKASKIMSTEYDMAFVQEAIELNEDDWESLTTRLRNGRMPYQQLIADTNPDRPTHWLKQRALAGKTLMLESRHEDNPRLFDGRHWTPEGLNYIARLNALTGARLQRLRFGRWVQAEGTVYDFDQTLHLVDRFEVPRAWRRILSIDFGYTHPFTAQWWAIDGDGRMYLYREIYMTHRLVRDHAQQIKALSAGERISAAVSDHDAEDRATLDDAGIPTVPAWKAIKPGIEAVQDRLRKAGDGKPRLFVLRDSLVERDPALGKKPASIVEEFDAYVWPKNDKEEPVKEYDHGMDAMRYAVAFVDGLAVEERAALLYDESIRVDIGY